MRQQAGKRITFFTAQAGDTGAPSDGVAATETLTLTGNAVNNETVVIGSRTYTWKTTLTGAADEVLIGGTASDSLDNLIAAIVNGAGEGTLYGTGTVKHADVVAAAGAGDTMDITANAVEVGTDGNSIATTETMTAGSWGGATMSGGVDRGGVKLSDVLGDSRQVADYDLVIIATAAGAFTYDGIVHGYDPPGDDATPVADRGTFGPLGGGVVGGHIKDDGTAYSGTTRGVFKRPLRDIGTMERVALEIDNATGSPTFHAYMVERVEVGD